MLIVENESLGSVARASAVTVHHAAGLACHLNAAFGAGRRVDAYGGCQEPRDDQKSLHCKFLPS